MVSVIPSNYIKIRFVANFHNEDWSPTLIEGGIIIAKRLSGSSAN